MKSSLNQNPKRTTVKPRRVQQLTQSRTRNNKAAKRRLKKRTQYQVDRARLIKMRTPAISTTKPAKNPYLGQPPNPITENHLNVAMAHGLELANAGGQSGPFIGAGAFAPAGGFMAKRDLRTKLKMTNIFYAPGYSTVPTTAQGGGYGYYRGRFHCIGNNLTTPIPGTTHRPFGFDQLAAFYTYYEVHSCSIRLNIQNVSYGGTRGVASPPGAAFACLFPISYEYSAIAGTNAGTPPNTGIDPTDDTISGPFWSREVLSLQPHVEHAVMTEPTGGKPWCSLAQHWRTSEILGTDTEDEFNFKGACTPGGPSSFLQPPTNVWNYVVSMNAIPRSGLGGGGASGAGAFGASSYLAQCVQVTLEWDVTFFDARLVAPSEAPEPQLKENIPRSLNSTSPEYPRLLDSDDGTSDDEKTDSEEDVIITVRTNNPFAL
jgi:hypothetical protein